MGGYVKEVSNNRCVRVGQGSGCLYSRACTFWSAAEPNLAVNFE